MSRDTLYLVDGTAQLFRAYFAIRGLTNPEGLPTNAVYGFTTMLRKLIRDESPTYIGVAFDVKGPVFRHEQYAEYKANRPSAPEDLNVQVPYAKQVCEVLGIPILELKGYEADDLIATYAVQAREAGFDVVVVAADKDLLQLVGDGITLLNPSKNVTLDAGGVEESFGVRPDQVRDVLGLMGDSVDNVPGVPGVGRKTALAIVSAYGNMEAAIARAHRFVSVYDGRDRLLEAIDAAAKEPELLEATANRIAADAEQLSTATAGLLEIEKDDSIRERVAAVAETLKSGVAGELGSATGKPGKTAVKPLAALKRELKALDRGSSKKTWYSIGENEKQALLSKELVTLHYEAPVQFESDSFDLEETDKGPVLDRRRPARGVVLRLQAQPFVGRRDHGQGCWACDGARRGRAGDPDAQGHPLPGCRRCNEGHRRQHRWVRGTRSHQPLCDLARTRDVPPQRSTLAG